MAASLKTTRFLILDCQTTGMQPSVGSLLEFSWAFASSVCEAFEIGGGLIQLPPGASIPPAVRAITGIRLSDLETDARPLDEIRAEFTAVLAACSDRPVALIHYAQFEEGWLRDLLQTADLPFDVICTQKISKKLFPKVPSRNIRGLTGYFGVRIGEIKRAPQHVTATQKIWQGLIPALTEIGVTTIDELRAWLSMKPARAARGAAKATSEVSSPRASYDYRVDREKRLALPAKPGIYKMIARDGEILYVGKATSLKDRVNSYFRGKKGRDPRKLEMMAQVWDLEVIECGSAVEAALIESDEIKRLNPPYNVSLKEGNRALLYYDRSLTSESLEQSSEHPVGPFRRFNAVEQMRLFGEGLREDLIRNVFYQPIENAVLENGYLLFEEKYPEFKPETMSVRDHLAFGLSLVRAGVQDDQDVEAFNETSAAESASAEPTPAVIGGLSDAIRSLEISPDGNDAGEAEDVELSAEDVLEKIERLYLRAARSYLRTKKVTRLLWADVSWTEKGETKRLSVRGGRIRGDSPARREERAPWKDLSISDYDRMSVLLMEISKVEHEICRFRASGIAEL